MTDRIKGLTVVFDKEYRDDDAESIINAIKMVKGVGDVQSHVADMDHYMAVSRARMELGSKIIDVIREDRKQS